MRAAGKPPVDLTISNPTECGFQYDEAAILRSLQDPSSLKYEPDPRGLVSARNAVSQYYAEQGARVSPEDIFLTTSTSEAYSFIFRTLCDPGDEILIPEPSYPLFEFLAEIQDVRLVRYPLVYDYGWQIEFQALEQAATPRTRAVIVVNPNNPTGNYCEPREQAALHQFAAARSLAIVADEVFLDFSLQGTRQSTFAGSSGALTFTLGGISKICGLPQMKVAWLSVSGPEPSKKQSMQRLEVIADTYLSMNAPVQLALPKFLSGRHTFQDQLLLRMKMNLAELDSQLSGQNSCTRLIVEGGWNAVIRVAATQSDEDLVLDLLSGQGIYAHPGHFYDFPPTGYLVVSLLTPNEEFFNGIQLLLSQFSST
ncbi:MAG TPA: pyridoxal phosphate-dependent aminotransferase [Candidatus Acidoferrum sp.]|nr:pyridoxal phosphate-dependent aminotransferase [Candidatus Acidoferrum sp.]